MYTPSVAGALPSACAPRPALPAPLHTHGGLRRPAAKRPGGALRACAAAAAARRSSAPPARAACCLGDALRVGTDCCGYGVWFALWLRVAVGLCVCCGLFVAVVAEMTNEKTEENCVCEGDDVCK